MESEITDSSGQKTYYFWTDIYAFDARFDLAKPNNWTGPIIKARSQKQAEKYCKYRSGYLRVVTTIADSQIRPVDVIIDATKFSPTEEEIANYESLRDSINNTKAVLLFCTNIRAVDPLGDREAKPVSWAGPYIKAYSWEQAEEYCKYRNGYLQVVGKTDEQPTGRAIVIDATSFEATDDDRVSLGYTNSEPNTSDDTCGVISSDVPELEEVELETGDVVVLASGSHCMTIKNVWGEQCDVVYFVGSDLIETSIPMAALRLMHR